MTRTRRLLGEFGRYAVPLCLLLAAVPAAAQAYKWTDASGRTHFSDTPPPDRKAEKITVKPQMPEDPAAVARARDWKTQLEESGMRRLEAQKESEAAARKARTDENDCRAARGRLDTLQRGGRVYHYGNDGQRHYLEDQDRPAAIRAAQERVSRSCR